MMPRCPCLIGISPSLVVVAGGEVLSVCVCKDRLVWPCMVSVMVPWLSVFASVGWRL